jgi:3-oxoacyl-[acyl-carrier protein] reductase
MTRKVLVTGSTRGIGEATAIAFARAGFDIALNGRSAEHLVHIEGALKQIGVRTLSLPADLANPDESNQMADRLIDAWGGVDILVNNAGITHSGTLFETTNDALTELIDINLRSMFTVTKRLAPHMMEQRWGRIINLTSMTARLGRGFVGSATYAASKGAIVSFTRGLAKEFGPHNVTVNAIAPGVVVTDMNRDYLKAHGADVVKGIPLGRFGKSEDVAHVVTFLASEGAGYVTGTVIDVNGGLVFG